MSNKKILFVATITGHINVFHIPYLKYFHENGYEVHVASKGKQDIKYCDQHFDLPFDRFPLKLNNVKVYRDLKKIIDENHYEIIHCNTPTAGVITRIAAKKSRKMGTEVIYTAHGFHFYKNAPLKNWIIYYPIEKICSVWTDCLITINEEDFRIAKRKFKAKRIEYVHGVGMNTQKFKKDFSNEEKSYIRKKLGISENKIILSYVAELNKNKNQELLIKVINEMKEEFPNIILLLVGKGELCNKYSQIIDCNNLQDNVKLLGKRNDINEILSITDIYIASSIREGLPVNIIEAMYKKIPVVANENRGHKELIVTGENGFLINSKDEMISRIKELICNIDLRKELGEKGNEKSKNYLIENVIKDMKRIYEKK